MRSHKRGNLLRNLRPEFSLRVLQIICLMYADAVGLFPEAGNFSPVLQLHALFFSDLLIKN
ncbi:MAG: hypothetical protein CM1200mP30_24980 [Pseudomonadota bacterium]|nr:MAG: hypothetical protein CM1200mP30_24980 [Pseudomonadota bacterium]